MLSTKSYPFRFLYVIITLDEIICFKMVLKEVGGGGGGGVRSGGGGGCIYIPFISPIFTQILFNSLSFAKIPFRFLLFLFVILSLNDFPVKE